MPSKGVQTYTYVSAPGYVEIEVSVPKKVVFRRTQQVFEDEDFEVDAAKILWPFNRTGRFQFKVWRDSAQLTEQWADIDPITGKIKDESTMDDIMMETRSLATGGLLVSYGLYESGPGLAGLPNRHQCYVTVTENFSAWQGTAAPPGSPAELQTFSHFVLPCPHDVGMNSLDTINTILKHAGLGASAVLSTIVPFLRPTERACVARIIQGLSDATVAKIAPNIIASMAITQKDTLATMLALGARYFEFRPAHCHRAILPFSPLPDKLYFQHGPIPGMAYDQFLNDIVLFLVANPTEVVVVHVRWDGVPAECARPTDEELQSYLDAAIALSGGQVIAGNLEDMQNATIRSLRWWQKRLLYVVNDSNVLSTYNDVANATIDGKSILTAFDKVLNEPNQQGKSMTVIQCQATATNIKDVVYYSVVTADVSTLALMSTKAACTHLLLPWVRTNALNRCRKDCSLVLMDDFMDGSLTDVAIQLSRARLGDFAS